MLARTATSLSRSQRRPCGRSWNLSSPPSHRGKLTSSRFKCRGDRFLIEFPAESSSPHKLPPLQFIQSVLIGPLRASSTSKPPELWSPVAAPPHAIQSPQRPAANARVWSVCRGPLEFNVRRRRRSACNLL